MTDDFPALGHIRQTSTGPEGLLRRRLPHPQDSVWRMLTEPQGLAEWLAPGSIEAHKGGRVHIDFGDSGVVIDSEVLDFAPQRLITYSWSGAEQPQRPLRWKLTAAGDETDLELTVTLPPGEDIAKACAGFDAHLEMLAAALEGVPIRFPFDLYLAARSGYQKMLPA